MPSSEVNWCSIGGWDSPKKAYFRETRPFYLLKLKPEVGVGWCSSLVGVTLNRAIHGSPRIRESDISYAPEVP